MPSCPLREEERPNIRLCQRVQTHTAEEDWGALLMKKFLVLPLVALLPACASIVEGTDQSITVSSNPTAAACELERAGGQIGVVNPTPDTVIVQKSSDDISVRCSKEGHDDGIGVLTSSFEGMTVGNIIFGGIIGLAVDAGSGAMHTYPSSIMVTLPQISN